MFEAQVLKGSEKIFFCMLIRREPFTWCSCHNLRGLSWALSPNFKLLRSPGIDSNESIPPAYAVCSLAGRYDNPIPTRFLAPIELLKIPALRRLCCQVLRGLSGALRRLCCQVLRGLSGALRRLCCQVLRGLSGALRRLCCQDLIGLSWALRRLCCQDLRGSRRPWEGCAARNSELGLPWTLIRLCCQDLRGLSEPSLDAACCQEPEAVLPDEVLIWREPPLDAACCQELRDSQGSWDNTTWWSAHFWESHFQSSLLPGV